MAANAPNRSAPDTIDINGTPRGTDRPVAAQGPKNN